LLTLIQGTPFCLFGKHGSHRHLVHALHWKSIDCSGRWSKSVAALIGLTIAFQSAEISIHSFVWRRLLDVVCGLMAGLSIVSMHYLASLLKMDQRLVEALSLRAAACGRSVRYALYCIRRLYHGRSSNDISSKSSADFVPVLRSSFILPADPLLRSLPQCCPRQQSSAYDASMSSAYFDEHGNIMVTNEGTLPSQRIAKRFVLQVCECGSTFRGRTSILATTRQLLFREGYCVAAADLAAQLQVPLVDGLGPLYDQVLGTGLLTAYQHGLKALDNGATQQLTIFEKGQLLFYTRRLSPHEIDHYTAAGFRFAPLNRVEGAIANTMQIPIGLLAIQMQRVQDFAYRTSVPCPPKQGTFFVCLAALARVRDSFRVLVPMDRQDELPDVQVSPYHMNSQQLSWLKRYNNWPAERFIWHIKLKEQNWSTLEDDEEKAFLIMLRTALGSLVTKIGERWPREMPARKLPAGLTLASWDLVRMRQHYYRGCNDQGRMRREVQEEFGPLLAKHEEAIRSEGQRVKSHKLDRTRSPCSDDSGVLKEDYWLEGRHADVRRGSIDSIVGHPHSWGGILATTDTVIEGVSKSTIELRNLTPQVTAGASAMVIAKEPKTWFLKGTVWVCMFRESDLPELFPVFLHVVIYLPESQLYTLVIAYNFQKDRVTKLLKNKGYRLTLVAQRKRSSTSYDVFAMVLLYVCERSHFRVAVVQLRYRMVMKRQKVDDKYTKLAGCASSRREKVLTRTDARHVVVLTQSRQVLVQLLNAFLMSLDALAHQFLFKL
ncbi:hypothetical protein KCV06_g260, partial [Aureobasidium melanogenum]